MSKQKISREIPLGEITLRRYEKPRDSGRDLVKKLCLSLGLLQPGDSRDIIVDVFYVLLKAKEKRELLDSERVKERVTEIRKVLNLPLIGIASSNIRRQLKRLKDIYLVENTDNHYRINEFSALNEIFNQKIERFLLSDILSRIKEYLEKVDEEFK